MISYKKNNQGFSIVEIVISIALIGIISAFVTFLILKPMQSYNVSKLRLSLTEEAYHLTNKIKKDVRDSLPNSIRVTNNGNKTFLEMVLISDGGKYRVQNNDTLNGDILDFTKEDTSFDILTHPIVFNVGEKVVIANKGITSFDIYNNDNMTEYAGVTGVPVSNVNIQPKKFPIQSEFQTFFVINKVITYMCDRDNGNLVKFWNYSLSNIQPNNDLNLPLSNGSKALISNNLKDCSFVFNSGQNTRNGQVNLMIQLANENQQITLYGDTSVPNI